MRIGSLDISQSSRPKIVAEIGINHGGSLDTAKHMAQLAAESGADIIKTQLHIPSQEMSKTAHSIIPEHCSSSIYQIMDECCLSLDEEFELKCFIEELGVTYLSTPFSIPAAHILGKDFGVKAFKIGSGECSHHPLLKEIAQYGLPVIVSTGMNSLSSCARTYQLLRNDLSLPTLMLHTTNIYPTPPHLVRLGGITELQSIADIDSVGLSDHTESNLASLGAVALGAVLLERHFTDTKSRVGPDISNSMDPLELRQLRDLSEQMYLMRNGSKEDLIPEEDDTRAFAFATLVTTRDLMAGETITTDNTTFKRPAQGDYLPADYESVLGKMLLIDVPADCHLKHSHFTQ